MTEATNGDEAVLFPKSAGERLQEARVALGLSITEIAARTRVPVRHLEAIEKSDHSSLPSATYAIGFAKAYARVVGLDEVSIGRDVREKVDLAPRRTAEFLPFETDDPSRLPPRGLVLIVGVLAAIVLAGIAIWYNIGGFQPYESADVPASSAASSAPLPANISPIAAEPSPVAPAAPTGGHVAIVANDLVWLRIYDATHKSIYEGEMKAGERYDVPAGIAHPLINIGRPDKVQITVNGSVVPPLGDGKRALKDVEISAEALLARPPAAPAPASPTATP